MPRAAPPATADDGSSTAAAPEPSMTSVSTTTVTDPSSVNTESAGVEDAESSQGGKPAQPEPGKDLTAEEEALLENPRAWTQENCVDRTTLPLPPSPSPSPVMTPPRPLTRDARVSQRVWWCSQRRSSSTSLHICQRLHPS